MLISELIKELEHFLEMHGDLEVRHTIGRVGDVEIDSVNIYKGHICLLNNHYLDNYTLRTSDKIENIDKDIYKYGMEKGINCYKCEHYHDDWCFAEIGKKRPLSFFEKLWVKKDDKLFKCYSPVDDELRELFYYRYLLLKEYDNRKQLYEKNGIGWEGSI